MRALERDDPRSVGRYRLLARLGAGGMAVVYLARTRGRRAAAVKVMHAELAADAAYRERFRREVRAARAVAGQYCPAVLDADPDAAIPYLVTEFLPSVSLRDAVRQHGPLPVDATWPLAAGIAEALTSIHRAGIAHLDLKPANVLLTADGPRLIDLGIAAEFGPRESGDPAGSWGFMAPEQVAGTAVGPASDVYSFGATLTFACTGTRQPDQITDARLRDVVGNCLRTDPRDRPAVADLLAYLASMTAGTGTPWLPPEVRAEIDRRVGEARNPPVALSPPASRPVRRRTLLVAGGGVLTVAAGALVLHADGSPVDRPAVTDGSRPAVTGPPPTNAAASGSGPGSGPARPHTLEFYAFGRTNVKSFTTAVDGQPVTVHGVALPYSRTVEIPPAQRTLTWRVAFHCTAGLFQWVVLFNGYRVGGGGGSSNNPDINGDESGETAIFAYPPRPGG